MLKDQNVEFALSAGPVRLLARLRIVRPQVWPRLLLPPTRGGPLLQRPSLSRPRPRRQVIRQRLAGRWLRIGAGRTLLQLAGHRVEAAILKQLVSLHVAYFACANTARASAVLACWPTV